MVSRRMVLPTIRLPGNSSPGSVRTISPRIMGYWLGISIICGLLSAYL